ncbi:MAG TPA: hypothetical protein VHP11_02215 [Tepidisphaeraceae bacterium]|nr:hypothetical protein [Tepidisphaeraceae bacterium]
MGTLWLKIKAWTKITVLVAIAILVIIFIILNLSAVVEPGLSLIFTSYSRPNLLLVLFLTSLISIAAWSLGGTVIKTVHQLREARQRGFEEKLARDVAEMKAKAAKLQTRPESSPPPENPV